MPELIDETPTIAVVPRYNPISEIYEFPTSFPTTIQKIGALPAFLPQFFDATALENFLRGVNGLVTIGGFDVDPSLYTVDPPSPKLSPTFIEYDRYECLVQKMARQMDLPTLSICRGAQIMDVAFGGTMYQDLPTQREEYTYNHMQGQPFDEPTHEVEVIPDTLLAKIVGAGVHRVNSMHHQAVLRVPECFTVCAVSGDGVIEGIEDQSRRYFLGVQWHPEEMNGIMCLEVLLRAMVEAMQK